MPHSGRASVKRCEVVSDDRGRLIGSPDLIPRSVQARVRSFHGDRSSTGVRVSGVVLGRRVAGEGCCCPGQEVGPFTVDDRLDGGGLRDQRSRADCKFGGGLSRKGRPGSGKRRGFQPHLNEHLCRRTFDGLVADDGRNTEDASAMHSLSNTRNG